MIEEWKDIKDYENLYQISNLGRVKSLGKTIIDSSGRKRIIKERILKGGKDDKGYLYVCLCKDGIHKYIKVHRLVAETFIPNPNNLPCVDHINTIRDDNRVENLRWVTYEENNNNPLTREKYKDRKHNITEETKKKMSEAKIGKPSPMTGKHHTEETKQKLREINLGKTHTEESKKKMSEAHKGKSANIKKVYCVELDKVFNSIKECAEELNIDSSHISKVCKGKRKTVGGYHFRYYEENVA